MSYSQYRGGVGIGSILDALDHYYGVPLRLVETVTIDNEGIHHSGKLVARVKHFEGFPFPLIRFVDKEWMIYGQHQWVIQEDGSLKIKPKVTLGCHEMPVFEISGRMASEELHSFIHYPMMTNYIDHPCYEIGKKAGHFFQGGSHDSKGEWIMIEFWNPKGVQAWVDYLAENFSMVNPDLETN